MSDTPPDSAENDLPELTTQSFIVKLWIEEAAGPGSPAVWRGHITHVPSGARRYIKDLDEATSFMAPYLRALGALIPQRRRRTRGG